MGDRRLDDAWKREEGSTMNNEERRVQKGDIRFHEGWRMYSKDERLPESEEKSFTNSQQKSKK